MAGYVDEKVAKVTLDNKGFSKNADDTVAALERMKKAFGKVNGKDATKNIASDMSEMTDTISKSTQKSEGLLSRLKGIFNRSAKGIDMSGAGQSIDRMNTDVASKTATTSSILSRLKGIFQKADNHQGFPNSIKSIDGLNSKVSGFDASPLSNAFAKAASSVQNSLSIMDIALGNVLGGMIQKAMSFTGQFFRGYGDGLEEYKNKLGSVQTIMTNTEWEIPDSSVRMRRVSGALEDLNDYADKTIYSFADMTRNIGTFTAAGVSLDKSAIAIKGISNLAAASGSNTQQASMAMYQLSQALAAGRVGLQDWNSVVNAGMGGKLFQDRLTQTAEKMGHARDMTKSFRDSLKDGWLTTEVLLETLKEFSTDESMLDAATKVKSFGQLVDTVQEAIGSGWATTWEYFLGGFEEAKSMWTSIGDIVNPFINDDQGKYWDSVLEMERSLGNYRNAMLKTWKDLGGQESLFNSIKNSFEIVFGAMTKFREGFRSVIGDYKQSAQVFFNLTKGIEGITNSLKNNIFLFKTASSLGKLVGNVFKTLGWILGNIGSGFKTIGYSAGSILAPLSVAIDKISKFLESIRTTSKYSTGWFYLGRAIANVFNIIGSLGRIALSIINSLLHVFFKMSSGTDIFARLMAILSIATSKLLYFVQSIESALNKSEGLPKMGAIFSKVFSTISSYASKVGNVIHQMMSAISNAFSSFKKDIDVNGFAPVISKMFKDMFSSVMKNINEFKQAISGVDIMSILKVAFGGLASFSIFKLFKKDKGGEKKSVPIIGPLLDALNDLIEKGDKIVDKVSEILTGLKGAIESFTTGLKTGSLLMIATSITMLALSMKVLAGMSSDDIVRSAGAIATVSYILTGAMSRLSKLDNIPPATAMNLIGFSFAVRILAKAMAEVSKLSYEELMKGVGGISAASLVLLGSMKILSKIDEIKVNPLKLLGFVFALKILVSAMKDLVKYNPDELLRGVASIGTLMVMLAGSMGMMDGVEVKARTSMAMLSFVLSIKVLVSAIKSVADMKPETLSNSVLAIGTVMAALVGSMRALDGAKINTSAIFGMIVFVGSVSVLVKDLQAISAINVDALIPAVSILVIIMGSLVMAMHAVEGAKVNKSAMAAMIIFAGSVKVLTMSLTEISNIGSDKLVSSVQTLAILMGSLVAVTHLLDGAKVNLSAILTLITFSISVKVLVSSLTNIANIAPDRLEPAMNSLMGILIGLTAITVILTNMSGGILSAIGASMVLLSFVPVLLSIGFVMTQLAAIPWSGMQTALIGLGVTLGALVASVAILSTLGASSLVGAATLLMLSTSLIAIAVPLKMLGSMSLAQIGVGLVAIGGALAILLAAGALAAMVAPGLAILAVTLVAIGVAAIGIGAGALLGAMALDIFTKALMKLSMIGATAVVNIVKAFDAFVRSLAQNAPSIVSSLIKVVLTALNGLAVLIPEFVNFGLKLLLGLIEGITNNLPQLINAAVRLLTELATAIVNNMSIIINVAIDIAVTFIEKLAAGLVENKDRIISSLQSLFLSLSEIIVTIIKSLAGPVLSAIVEVLTPVRDFIITWIQEIGPVILPFFTAITDTLQVLFTTVSEIIRSLADVIISIIGGIETVVNGVVSIVTVIGETIKAFIQGVVDVINAIANVITATGDSIRYVLEGVDNIFVSFGNNVKTTLEGVSNVIKTFAEGIKTALEGVGKIFESIGTAIKTALDGVADVIKAVGDAAKSFGEGFKLFGEGVKLVGDYGASAATGLASLTVEVAKLGASAYAGNLQGFTKDIKDLDTACTSLAGSVGGLSATATAMNMISVSASLLSGTLPTVNTAFTTMSTSMTTLSTSITPVSTAFTGLIAPVTALMTTLTSVSAVFMNLNMQFQMLSIGMSALDASMLGIQNGVTLLSSSFSAMPAIIELFNQSLITTQQTLNTFFMELTNSSTGFTTLSQAAMEGMMQMQMAVQTGMMNIQTVMLSGISTLAAAVFTGFTEVTNAVTMSMTSVSTAVQTGMLGVVTAISTSMQSVATATSTAFSGISTAIQTSISSISANINQGMSGVSQTITSRVHEIQNSFTQMNSTVNQIVSTMMAAMSSSISSGMSSAASRVSSGMSSIIGIVSSYSGSARSAGYNVGYYISAGVADGMNANMWAIESAANRIISKAREAARAAADIHSPSRLFAKDVGKFIPMGVAKGIGDAMPKMVDEVTDSFGKGFSDAADSVVSQGDVFANMVSDAVNGISDMLDVAIDDMNYAPTITPVVDMSNLDKMKMSDYSLDYRGRISTPTPLYGVPQQSNTSTVVNNDNSKKEYSVNVNVDTGGKPVNTKELAREIQSHIKSFDDQSRRGKGEEVFW